MHAHGLKLEDLRRVADGPTSTIAPAPPQGFSLMRTRPPRGIERDELRRIFGFPCVAFPPHWLHSDFHTMGMLFGARCYVRWRAGSDGVQVVAFALLRDGRWEATCDPAHESEHDWTGGLWLAAIHYIGKDPATLEEVRAASLEALKLGTFVQQLKAACAAQVPRRVPGRKRRKGRKPAAVQVTLRLVPDVLARWRATGPGWQSRMVALIAQPDAATATPTPRRTRSAKGQGGVLVSLRIPPLALARWRATGAGWQSRIAVLLAKPV